MAQTLQERRFESLHQVKNHDQLRCLPKAKGLQKGQWSKVVINTSYDHMTSYRNENYNCYKHFLLKYSVICLCVYDKYFCFFSLIPLLYNIRCIDFISQLLSIVNFTSQYLSYRISKRGVNITQGLYFLFWGRNQYVFGCIQHSYITLGEIMTSLLSSFGSKYGLRRCLWLPSCQGIDF